MSLEKQLAEQLVSENNRLKDENNELMELNESLTELATKVDELGGLESIQESVNKVGKGTVITEGENEILESYTSLVENFGDLETISESLSNQSNLLNTYGTIEEISEALNRSKDTLTELKEFVDKNGSLEEVEEALTALDSRMPRIEESLAFSNKARSFIHTHGTFDEISEALNTSLSVLTNIDESKREEDLKEVCESMNIAEDKAKSLLDKYDLSADGLVDLCESLDIKPRTGAINESFKQSSRKSASLMGSMVNGTSFLNKGTNTKLNDINEDKKESRFSKSRFETMCS